MVSIEASLVMSMSNASCSRPIAGSISSVRGKTGCANPADCVTYRTCGRDCASIAVASSITSSNDLAADFTREPPYRNRCSGEVPSWYRCQCTRTLCWPECSIVLVEEGGVFHELVRHLRPRERLALDFATGLLNVTSQPAGNSLVNTRVDRD